MAPARLGRAVLTRRPASLTRIVVCLSPLSGWESGEEAAEVTWKKSWCLFRSCGVDAEAAVSAIAAAGASNDAQSLLLLNENHLALRQNGFARHRQRRY